MLTPQPRLVLSTDEERRRIRTVALVARKGGSGKSTIATALAVAHELAGGRAVVVDLDPQGSATAWGALREADRPVVVAAQARRLQPVLDAARAGGANLMIIDTPPALADAALAAARVADLVLIPCRPALADLHAIMGSLGICRDAGAPTAVVVNAAPPAGALVDQARTALADQGAELAPVIIGQRIAHVRAFAAGLTAAEFEPAGKAAQEIAALYDWLTDPRGTR